VTAHRSRSRTGRLAAAVTSLTVVLILLGTGVASAHFPQSIDNTIPADGEGASTSSAIPSTARQGTIAAVPATAGDDAGFKALGLELSTLPTKGAKFIHCLGFSLSNIPYTGSFDEDASETAPTLFLLFLNACLQIAFDIDHQAAKAFTAAPSSTSATPKPCFRLGIQVAITITKANGKFTMHIKGTTQKWSGKGPAVVTCQVKNHGAFMTLKPRLKGKTLRKAVGPKMGIGVVNPGSKPVTVKTTFAVK
jgi:hypothetical protein